MLTTRAHPDEFVRGHIGRLRVINLCPDAAAVVRGLGEHFDTCRSETKPLSLLDLLALACETELTKYVRSHTLLPVLRAVANERSDIAHGDPSDLATIRRNALRQALSHAVLCQECVEEDVAFWGYSFWRLSQQLPGLLRCSKHGSPLLQVMANDAFDRPPLKSLPSARPILDGIKLDNAVLLRYAEIIQGFADFEKPLSRREAAFKLGAKAKERGLRVARTGRRPTLTDVALESLPETWIRKFLPDFPLKTTERHSGPMYNVAFFPCTPVPCALALALLFDSADEALTYWATPHPSQPIAARPQNTYGFDFWNGAPMLRSYLATRGSHREIARQYGIDPKHLNKMLNDSGLPAIGGIDFEKTGRALLEYFQGETLDAAAAAFGADVRKMHDFLRIAGSRLRDALRPKAGETSSVVAVINPSFAEAGPSNHERPGRTRSSASKLLT